MNKILMSLLTITLVSFVAVGATQAYFSDTETSTGNSFTAGTLSLVPSTTGSSTGTYVVTPGGDGINGNVVFSYLVPGDSGNITWTLNNAGNLPGFIDIESPATTFGPGTETEPEIAVAGNDAAGGDLDQYLGMKLTRNGTYILGDATTYAPASGLLAVLNAEKNQAIPAVGTITYVLSWDIPSDIPSVDDNIIQGDTMALDLTFELGQTAGQ